MRNEGTLHCVGGLYDMDDSVYRRNSCSYSMRHLSHTFQVEHSNAYLTEARLWITELERIWRISEGIYVYAKDPKYSSTCTINNKFVENGTRGALSLKK